MRLISELINAIKSSPRITYVFNDTLMLTVLVPSFPVLPAIFALNLNQALLLLLAGKSSIVPLSKNGSSLY